MIGNAISGSYRGIRINADFTTIIGNTVQNSASYGIYPYSNYCAYVGNISTDNDIGFGVEGDSNSFSDNICTNTADGTTQRYGIVFYNGADNNKVYNNRFYNHTVNNILDVASGNVLYDKHSDLFMDAIAVSATHVKSNEDLSEGIPNTFTLDAQPDIPRTLSGHFDAHAQITAYTIDIVGIDAKGNTVTEEITEANGWDWETSNAFTTITSIIMSARTGTGVGDTMDIGMTDVLGLSNVIYATGDVYKIKKNNGNATVATAQVNTTYDTYDMSVIGLAGANDFTIYYKSNLNIIE